MNGNILIVDDEQQLRKLLLRIISLEQFTVYEAGDLRNARTLLDKHSIDVVVCDVKLPDGNGVDFIREVKQKFPLTEIFLLTAYGNIPDGVQAMKNGAFDYLVKGDDNDKIIPLMFQAVARVIASRKAAIKIESKSSQDFLSILGNSLALKKAIEQARRIAASDAPVLLLGETGTGKEVFANAIHANSKRKDHSIVAINCSTFSEGLLESELFGHKAGAYTGATKDKQGLVEIADKGTLFLDEIGELPSELQAKLLRFLENGEFIKLGDTRVSRVDTRLIAATNRNLLSEVEKRRFREDLYYRLNVFSIELAPLRDRVEDIAPLAKHFLQQFAQAEGKPGLTISPAVLKLLSQYPWKGNIRELKNVMQRAVILSDGEELNVEALPFEIQTAQPTSSNQLTLAAVEKQHIIKMLSHTNGNKTKTAQLLDIGLATLYRKMEEYKISAAHSK